ncbi:MAG: helix-turn-helix transcriptional regulator [Pseudomonadota bacterium]
MDDKNSTGIDREYFLEAAEGLRPLTTDEIDFVMSYVEKNGAYRDVMKLQPEMDKRIRDLVETGEPHTLLMAHRILVRAHWDAGREHERWREIFGLTKAECDLAAALVGGETMQSFADAQGKKYSTVKSQLLSIFRKTETSRQVELVNLLKA